MAILCGCAACFEYKFLLKPFMNLWGKGLDIQFNKNIQRRAKLLKKCPVLDEVHNEIREIWRQRYGRS